jgi:hypothetical protein
MSFFVKWPNATYESILPNFFLRNNGVFPLSAIRLGHFIEDELFSDDINTQAYQ